MNWIRDLYAWACERLYDELAWSYDGVSWLVSAGWWTSWRGVALAHVQGRVLELGFGTGNLLCALGAAGRPVVGLELSPAMHGITARKLSARGLAVPAVCGTAQVLPFSAGIFDTVVATFPAPYILRPETLGECRRVLRPGGRLVVVGLWVAPRGGRGGLGLPVFLGRPSDRAVDALAEHFRRAGLPHYRPGASLRLGAGGDPDRRKDTRMSLQPHVIGAAGILRTETGLRLLNLPGRRVGYANAQLDDYEGRARQHFSWRPPVRLTVRARFSHGVSELLGTAGFGFWNDPFLMTGWRVPALPRAAWFFFASPPGELALTPHTPGHGWKAAVIDALHPAAVLALPGAPLAAALMRSQRLAAHLWPILQRLGRTDEAVVPASMIEWHTYELDWQPSGVRFSVDGETLLAAVPAPSGPLGLVIWLDNQWLAVRPTGHIRHGVLGSLQAQWLEVASVVLE